MKKEEKKMRGKRQKAMTSRGYNVVSYDFIRKKGQNIPKEIGKLGKSLKVLR